MYVCMYVCMHVCMYVFMYACICEIRGVPPTEDQVIQTYMPMLANLLQTTTKGIEKSIDTSHLLVSLIYVSCLC